MKAATEGTSESFGAPGRSHIQTHKPDAQLQSRLLIILAKSGGEWTTHKALTERHAAGRERQIEIGGEERGEAEEEEEDVGFWSN